MVAGQPVSKAAVAINTASEPVPAKLAVASGHNFLAGANCASPEPASACANCILPSSKSGQLAKAETSMALAIHSISSGWKCHKPAPALGVLPALAQSHWRKIAAYRPAPPLMKNKSNVPEPVMAKVSKISCCSGKKIKRPSASCPRQQGLPHQQ